jgi:ATP-binding cassette, subfamily C, bacterial CydD
VKNATDLGRESEQSWSGASRSAGESGRWTGALRDMATNPELNTGQLHRRLKVETRAIRPLLTGIGAAHGWTALVTVGQMFCLSRIVAGVFLEGKGWAEVQPWMLGLMALIVARALLLWAAELLAQRGAARLKTELRNRLFEHVLRLGPVWSERERSGELVSTAVDGIEKLEDYFARYVPAQLSLGIVPVTILVFVFAVDWLSGLVLCVTGPLIPIFMVLIGKRAEKASRNQWEALSRLGSHFLDVLQGIKTLKVFGQSRVQGARIRAASDRYRKATIDVLKVAFLSGFTLELAASISTAVVAVEVGVRLIRGTMEFQPGLFVLLLAPEFYLPFRTLGARHHAGLEGVAAADRIYAILDAVPLVSRGGTARPGVDKPPEIRIERLTYRYPGGPVPALDRVTAVIEAGRITALAGPSGSGKSTLVNLLLRFLEVEEGRIWLGDVPLETIDPRGLRERIAFVPQHPHLFNGTVLDNLRLACPDASEARIREAIRHAGADAVLDGLPEGARTMLGENGARLSGGERQRLAMARAFLKETRLLVLDEPASALDPESEEAMHRALERLASSRTVLIIAHRVSTLRTADRVLLLDQGRVVGSGAHVELTRSSALYARMTALSGEEDRA